MSEEGKKPGTWYRAERVGRHHHDLRGFAKVGEPGEPEQRKFPETGDKVAAGPGFEPGLSDSESLVLPLHHPAMQRGIL